MLVSYTSTTTPHTFLLSRIATLSSTIFFKPKFEIHLFSLFLSSKIKSIAILRNSTFEINPRSNHSSLSPHLSVQSGSQPVLPGPLCLLSGLTASIFTVWVLLAMQRLLKPSRYSMLLPENYLFGPLPLPLASKPRLNLGRPLLLTSCVAQFEAVKNPPKPSRVGFFLWLDVACRQLAHRQNQAK